MTAPRDYYEKDFYQALGVSKDASASEIKKTYRKLAQELHPDKHPDDAKAEARFKEVSEAYHVLSDATRRKEYDEAQAMVAAGGPMNGMGAGPDGFGGFRAGPGGASFDFSDLFAGRGGGSGNINDLFDGLFGGAGAGGGRGGQRGPQRGRDQQSQVRLGFEEAVRGSTMTLQLTGEDGRSRTMTVRIPAGVRGGGTIRLAGKGEPGRHGGPAGDLLVTVEVGPHPLFGRKGDDLTLTVPITFAEATLGTTLRVPTLDGSVGVKVAAGTPSGRTLRVRGRGVQTTKHTGDLLVTVEVAVPQKLTDRARALLEEFAAAQPDDPRPQITAALGHAAAARTEAGGEGDG